MRRSVSSPDETARKGLKIWRAAEYFLTNFKVFHLTDETLCRMLDITSQKKMILEGEIKNVKISSSFRVISKHSFI